MRVRASNVTVHGACDSASAGVWQAWMPAAETALPPDPNGQAPRYAVSNGKCMEERPGMLLLF